MSFFLEFALLNVFLPEGDDLMGFLNAYKECQKRRAIQRIKPEAEIELELANSGRVKCDSLNKARIKVRARFR